MSSTPILHDRFTLERRFSARPSQVFAAFAQLEQKRHWFGCHEGIRIVESRMDFRVGGIAGTSAGLDNLVQLLQP